MDRGLSPTASAAWHGSPRANGFASCCRSSKGQFRLRLVLRESVDLLRGANKNPMWWWHYDHGPDLALSVLDIVIERKDGRRYQVDRRATISEAMAAKPVPMD
jgi:hypothetical protein